MPGVLSDRLNKTRGPTWKKVMWWCIGALVVSCALIILVVRLLKRQTTQGLLSDLISGVQRKVDLVDIQAKLRVARAHGAETALIDQIKATAEIKDHRVRLQALAAALSEDY
jgi:hypothetical protein